MLSNYKICFNVFNIQNYDKVLCRLNESNETLWGTTSTNFPI